MVKTRSQEEDKEGSIEERRGGKMKVRNVEGLAKMLRRNWRNKGEL